MKRNDNGGLLGVLACALGLAVAAIGADAPIVRNGGFEDMKDGATAGWNAVGKRYVYVDGAGRSGTRALAFENDDPKSYSFPGQRIDLKPGKTYRFEVWVRTENLVGAESGASICIEWNGPDGKWMGGAYANGVKGTRDWTRVEGVTQPIPVGARGFRVSPYVRKGMTGKAWFDDVSVTPYVRPPVMGLYSSAYRNVAAFGPVTFKAAVCLDADEYPLPATRGVLRYTGADGQPHEAATVIAGNEATATLDVAVFAPGKQKVTFVLVKENGKLAGSADCWFTRVEKMPARRVWFDAQGRTIVDGKPFFPLGMYWGGVTTNKFEIYAKGPFNCLMPYASPTSKDLMDLCHAHGVKVIYSVKDVFSGTHWAPKGVNTEADEVAYITARVSKFKDHPALLAWYLNDELPLSMLPRLSARRDLLEKLDPGHPGWVVLYQYTQIADYMPSFDVIGTDPYPIPRPAAMASKWTRATRAGTMGLKPLWQVPQAFDWAAYKKDPEEKKKNRAPTEAELRSMCWQCIAAGANGLVMYSWFDLWKEPNGVPFSQRWAEVCRVGEEIKRYIPVLLSDELSGFARPVMSACAEDPLSVRTWRFEGEVWLLAVNSSDKPLDAQIDLAERCASATAAFGPAPKLAGDGRKLTVPLAPLELTLIRLH